MRISDWSSDVCSSDLTVFEKLNLQIPKGKITAIVGESGSGKTTLLSLLHNMYPIQDGKITVGDFDVRYLTHDSLRRLVGVVPQEVHLFAGNIVQNIAIGDLSPDMNGIMKIGRAHV